MNPPPLRSRFYLAVLLLAGWGSSQAQDVRSPFMPKTEKPAEVQAVEDVQLQFVGVFGFGKLKRFCIFDVASGRSEWQTVGEVGDDFTIQSYDAGNKSVTVDHGGRSLQLVLTAADVAKSAAARPAAVAGTPGTGLVETVRVNPTPADERRRLEAVAAEVRRRRALRQAAAKNPPPQQVQPR